MLANLHPLGTREGTLLTELKKQEERLVKGIKAMASKLVFVSFIGGGEKLNNDMIDCFFVCLFETIVRGASDIKLSSCLTKYIFRSTFKC